MILKIILKKKEKQQATSGKLDIAVGFDRMNLERNNYDTRTSTRKNKNSG